MESDHYFSSSPSSPENLRRIRVSIAGHPVEVTTAGGVFSPDHIDTGTTVLLEVLLIGLLKQGCLEVRRIAARGVEGARRARCHSRQGE